MDESTPSPFAPPGAPAPAPADPPISREPDSAANPDGEPEPSRRRWPIVAAAGLIVVGLVALVAVVGSRGGDGETVDPVDEHSFSLARAIDDTTSSVAARYEMTMEAPSLGSTTVKGALDATGTASTTMMMDVAGLDGDIVAILDVPGDTAYYQYPEGPLRDAIHADGTAWVSMPLDLALSAGGIDPDEYVKQINAPTDAVAVLEGIEATFVGRSEIDGDEVAQYHLELDAAEAAEAFEANPLMAETPPADELPTSISYDAYVTVDNHLRRLDMSMEVGGETMTVKMDMFPVADDFRVELPDPDDVAPIPAEFLGG